MRVIEAATILNWFDYEYLKSILPFNLTIEMFNQLINLSHVEKFTGMGFNIHERTRNMLLSKLWETNKLRFKTLSRLALEYSMTQNQSDIQWKIDSLYHCLISNSKNCDKVYLKQIENVEAATQIFCYAIKSGFLTKKNREVVEKIMDYVRKY